MIASGQDEQAPPPFTPRLHSSSRPTTGARALRPVPRTRPSSRRRAKTPPSARRQPCHATRPGMGPRHARSGAAFPAGGSAAASRAVVPRDQASVLVYPLGTRSVIDEEIGEHRKSKVRERVERKGKGWGASVAYLDEKSAVVNRERCKDVLENLAESGTVDTCHTRRKPSFTNSPALDA